MNTTTVHSRPNLTLKQIVESFEGVIIIIACYLTFFLGRVRSRWGMKREELGQSYPGDSIVPEPKTQFSHGIDINAPAEFVWPWIAQIGQGRGGFYSYELLENIAGLQIYNSDEILPQFQNPQVGDEIPFGAGLGYPLIICEPGKAMTIEVALNMDNNETYDLHGRRPEKFLHLTWLWYIKEMGEGKSRFISRNRVESNDSFRNRMLFGWVSEPIIFAMDRKMCIGIKKRAERYYKNSLRKASR